MQSVFGEQEAEFHGHNVLSPMTKRILSTRIHT